MPTIYKVVINTAEGAAPNDGFIDPTTVAQYMAAGAAPPSTLAKSIAKARANFRYKLLCQQMSMNSNVYTSDMVAAGADCNTAPSSFTFLATIEHGIDSFYVHDELNNRAVLTGVPAFVRSIARALIASETTELMYLDPTATTAPGNSMAFPRVGPRFAAQTIGPVASNLTAANALITVTAVA